MKHLLDNQFRLCCINEDYFRALWITFSMKLGLNRFMLALQKSRYNVCISILIFSNFDRPSSFITSYYIFCVFLSLQSIILIKKEEFYVLLMFNSTLDFRLHKVTRTRRSKRYDQHNKNWMHFRLRLEKTANATSSLHGPSIEKRNWHAYLISHCDP